MTSCRRVIVLLVAGVVWSSGCGIVEEVANAPRLTLRPGQTASIELDEGAIILRSHPPHAESDLFEEWQVQAADVGGVASDVRRTESGFSVELGDRGCCVSMWGYVEVDRPGRYSFTYMPFRPPVFANRSRSDLIVVPVDDPRNLAENGSPLQVALMLPVVGAFGLVAVGLTLVLLFERRKRRLAQEAAWGSTQSPGPW